MRTISLIALVIFSFPAFAHASAPTCSSFPPVASPLLTVYTISNTTIYPTATAESGLATTTAIDTCFSERVYVSIKIVLASDTTVKPYSYSNSNPGVTDPDPKVWNGKDSHGALVVTGVYTILISATATADSKITTTDSSRTITVASPSDPTPPNTSSDSKSTPATETVSSSSSNSGTPEYLPIPTLQILIASARTVSSGADTAFTAVVYDSKGNKRNDAVVTYAFGDGMRKTGASVYHEYYDPGEYLAVVRATTSDGGNTQKEIVVTVKDASIKISSVSPRGIMLANKDSRTFDLSLWRLSMGGQEFKIPEDTQILAGHTILFSSKIIELPITDTAFLLYPSGEIAASYGTAPTPSGVGAPTTPVGAVLQPSSSVVSYEQVQKVEPIISQEENVPVHEEAVGAPAAANELAAAGAVLSPPTLSAPTGVVGF